MHRHARPFGLNMIGYARAGLGLGETLRRFAEAALQDGLPFTLVDVDLNLGERGRDLRLERFIGNGNPFDVNLLFVNADQMPAVRGHLGEAFFENRRNIGVWFWELERFPQAWHGAFQLVDEVWVATRFVREAIAPHTAKPVRLVRHPVEVPAGDPLPRSALGIPDDRFVFLFSFDFHSYVARKNPQAAIAAFRRAFRAGDDRAVLLLKSVNGSRATQAVANLNEAIGNDPRILLIDQFLDYQRAMALVRTCDAYLSLHRSEGFGQGLAEAMYLGKPVIATAYSGNLDFMDGSNSALVPARLVEVGANAYPFGEGQVWAEPDTQRAAALMRRVVEDRPWREAIGRAAASSIRERNSAAACARSVREALGAS